MKQVGPLIKNLLHRYHLWQGYQQFLLLEKWPDLVGSSLAEVTRAESISKGVMRVMVKDSTWAHHLSLLKPQLVNKLNDYAESKIIKDLFFMVGDIEQKEI